MAKRWFHCDIRVRYAETDQMGVVYHANYLNWFEWGRTEMVRELGMAYRDLEGRGLLLPVTRAELDFVKPARYDDMVRISTAVDEWTKVRIAFRYEVRRLPDAAGTALALAEGDTLAAPPPADRLAGELLVTGRTQHVWVNREFRPVRIDKEAPEFYRLLQRMEEA